MKLFHSGTGSGLFLGVAVPCGNGSKLFYLLLQGAEENFFFILDPSGRISIVHDSDLGSGYGTMRIRIQTMLIDCFYSGLLQKILNFCENLLQVVLSNWFSRSDEHWIF